MPYPNPHDLSRTELELLAGKFGTEVAAIELAKKEAERKALEPPPPPKPEPPKPTSHQLALIERKKKLEAQLADIELQLNPPPPPMPVVEWSVEELSAGKRAHDDLLAQCEAELEAGRRTVIRTSAPPAVLNEPIGGLRHEQSS